jgi:hypothetical protein
VRGMLDRAPVGAYRRRVERTSRVELGDCVEMSRTGLTILMRCREGSERRCGRCEAWSCTDNANPRNPNSLAEIP